MPSVQWLSIDPWIGWSKLNVLFGSFGAFFPPHLAVSIYQPSVSVTRYFYGAKTGTKSHIYIFFKNINCSKGSQCTWKSKKQILATLSTCPGSKVNSIKTFLRTVGTRALFGDTFLWNSNHSVLLDFFNIALYLESDRFKTLSVLRISLVYFSNLKGIVVEVFSSLMVSLEVQAPCLSSIPFSLSLFLFVCKGKRHPGRFWERKAFNTFFLQHEQN